MFNVDRLIDLRIRDILTDITNPTDSSITNKNNNWYKLQRRVEHIPNNYANPSAHLIEHMTYLQMLVEKERIRLHKQQAENLGSTFEWLMSDIILNTFEWLGKLDELKSIYTNSACRIAIPELALYCADIDMFLNERVQLNFKISRRERWKQWDRDASVMEKYIKRYAHHDKICIFFRENEEKQPKDVVADARHIEGFFASDAILTTPFDEKDFNRILKQIVLNEPVRKKRNSPKKLAESNGYYESILLSRGN